MVGAKKLVSVGNSSLTHNYRFVFTTRIFQTRLANFYKIPKPLRFMRCNVTQKFRQLIPHSPFISLIASIAKVYRGRLEQLRSQSFKRSRKKQALRVY